MSKASNGQSSRRIADDEISLIDLAKVLVLRWKLMAVIFSITVLGAFLYALMMERTYEYVSLYQVAEQEPINTDTSNGIERGALEKPRTVLAKVDNIYLDEVTRELRSSKDLERLPFEVSVSNPGDTLLIRLSSETYEKNVALVHAMHTKLLEQIMSGQQHQLERRRTGIERQLESARRALEAAHDSTDATAGDVMTSYINRVAELEDRLTLLREGQIVKTAVQSLKPKGTGRAFILMMAVLLGAISAIICAFFMQFVVAVRESLSEE